MGVATFDVAIVDEEGSTVGGYAAMPHAADPAPGAGTAELFWEPGFDVHPDEGSAVAITATVELVEVESVDIVFPIGDIPAG